MKKEQLQENVIRAEGYAEGFRAGFIACAKQIAAEMAKEEKEKSPAEIKEN